MALVYRVLLRAHSGDDEEELDVSQITVLLLTAVGSIQQLRLH